MVTAIDVFGHTKLAFLKRILLFGMLLGLAVLLAVGWLSSRRALQPLESKIKKRGNQSSNLNVRLEVPNSNDEIGELAIAFNRMLDRIQAGFEAQRGFVANASHEQGTRSQPSSGSRPARSKKKGPWRNTSPRSAIS